VNTLLLAPEIFTGDGGITRILRLYLRALCEIAGDAGTVRLLSLNDAAVDPGMLARYSDHRLAEVRVCDRSRVRYIAAAFRMSAGCDRIVCGHVGQLPVAWAVSRLRPRIRTYLVAHGIEVWRPFSALERRAIRSASRVLCVSAYSRDRLLENCPMPPERAAVLPNALDPSLESAHPAEPPPGPPVILSVSRLSVADGYKGIGHLIEAMPALLVQVPGTRLRIVGRGDALPAMRALAERTGVGPSVDFLGFVPDERLQEEFAGCRLFALPSEREGFGLVYLEAMAHGRPCLGARAGGTPEVITEDSGVLVEYGNVPALAAALAGVLRRDWSIGPILERARRFSYGAFRGGLASLLAE
jgi:glycosyltransferase involved in cell wall biosynthesis